MDYSHIIIQRAAVAFLDAVFNVVIWKLMASCPESSHHLLVLRQHVSLARLLKLYLWLGVIHLGLFELALPSVSPSRYRYEILTALIWGGPFSYFMTKVLAQQSGKGRKEG